MPGLEQRCRPPAVLLVGGLDPSGGAGLAADLSAVAALGCHGMPVASAWTIQDGRHVAGWHALSEADVRAQLLAAARAAPPAAVKTGMLAEAGVVAALADWFDSLAAPPPLVIDPVLAASEADFDGDGRVDLVDFAIMRGSFGNTLSALAPAASPAAPATALHAAAEPIAAAATSMVQVVSQPLDDSDANDDSIVTATFAPAVDLLMPSPSLASQIPESHPIPVGSPATTLYRAATAEYDLRPLNDELPTVEADDLLTDILAESRLAVSL